MNDMARTKVVMLTRESAASCFIAKALASDARLDLSAVVCESNSQGKLDLLKLKLKRARKNGGIWGQVSLLAQLPYLFLQDRRLDACQRTAWSPDGAPDFPDGVKHFEVGNFNDPATAALIKSLDADVIFVFGTRILKPATFESARFGAVNLHTGLTPEYRGAKSEFWALYNDEPDMVGYTLHMIDAGIDTGAVICQEQVPVAPDDDELTLRVKTVEAAAGRLGGILCQVASGSAPRLDLTGRKGAVYSTPAMAQYMSLHRRLRKQGAM